MAVEINGKVYRNLPEQVKKNQDDIEELQGLVAESQEDIEGLDERIEAIEENPVLDLNLENGATTGSLEQVHDGSTFTFVNPNSPLGGLVLNIGIADGTYATMLGGKGRVEGKRSFVNGTQVVATANYAHAEGNNTHADGVNSHTEGIQTWASGSAAHAEGSSTAATNTGAHAEGYDTHATGVYAHTEGLGSVASGDGAHAEGMSTHAVGNYSHAEGAATYANALYSHAGGQDSAANGQASFASGYHVVANRMYQTVIGKYNLGQSPNTLFEVGNGTAEYARKNAFEVYEDGTVKANNQKLTSLTRHHFDIVLNHTDLALIPADSTVNININALSTSKTPWTRLSELDGGGYIVSAFGNIPLNFNYIFELKLFYSALGNGTLLLNVHDLTDNTVKAVAVTTVGGGMVPNTFPLLDSVTEL